MFSNNINYQAIDIPFNWNADYANGKSVSEYDLETHKKNDFYLIDRNQVIKFGIFGQNAKYYFEMYDGSFYLRGRRIDIEYHMEDENKTVLGLTANFQKKDIITYKEAFADINPNRQGVQKSNLKSINFGYKTKYLKNNIELFFQAVLSVQFYESSYMELKLTSNVDCNGYLVIKSRGVELERFEAPMINGRAGQLNWIIK